jgi:hypothetical protein
VTTNDDQALLGKIRLAAAKKSRSAGRNARRCTCRRRTASSWRRTTISRSLDAADQNRRHNNCRTRWHGFPPKIAKKAAILRGPD